METKEELNEIQDRPVPMPKMHRIKIRCRFCGHRYGLRKANIYTMEDKSVICEFCNRKV